MPFPFNLSPFPLSFRTHEHLQIIILFSYLLINPSRVNQVPTYIIARNVFYLLFPFKPLCPGKMSTSMTVAKFQIIFLSSL